jgi:uncharacterized membrane protein
MIIEYEITENDYLFFNMYHFENSKTVKNTFALIRFIFPIIFLFLSLRSWINFEGLNPVSIFAFVFACVWLIFFPKWMKKSVENRTRKIIREGNNKGLLGKKKLEINEDYIIETDQNAESKHKWNVIEKVVNTQDYIFIYASAVSAYIIPINAFKSKEERDNFLHRVNIFRGLE